MKDKRQKKKRPSSPNHGVYASLNFKDQAKVDAAASLATITPLSDELGPYDVVCGRHSRAFNNVGNRRFRLTVSMSIDRYASTKDRKEKTELINEIRDLIFDCGGRFLQSRDGAWVDLDKDQAREKVGHAVRDTLATVVRSVKQSEDGYAKQLFSLERAKLSFFARQQSLSMSRVWLQQPQQFQISVPQSAIGGKNSTTPTNRLKHTHQHDELNTDDLMEIERMSDELMLAMANNKLLKRGHRNEKEDGKPPTTMRRPCSKRKRSSNIAKRTV